MQSSPPTAGGVICIFLMHCTACLPPTLGASGYLILILAMQKLRLGLKPLALNQHSSTYLWGRPSSEFPDPLYTPNNSKTTSHVTRHVRLVIARPVCPLCKKTCPLSVHLDVPAMPRHYRSLKVLTLKLCMYLLCK